MKPKKPHVILVAYRCGEEFRQYLKEKLDPAGVIVILESKEAAEESARRNGTDPMGLNFPQESEEQPHGKSKSKSGRAKK
jgi:hypothetical protein